MFKIAICDDDNDFIQYMEKIINDLTKNKEETEFYECHTEEKISDDMKKNRLDLLILDIRMQGADGNKVAIDFRKKYPNTTLIFCSEMCILSPEMVKVSPYRFILKNYPYKRMMTELKEVIDYITEKKNELLICGHGKYEHFQVNYDEILYISIARRGSYLHIGSKTINNEKLTMVSCKKTVDELYEILKDYDFAYAHNSYIVNLKFVKQRTKDEIMLMNGEILTVSRSKTREFRRKMENYLNKTYK